MDLNKTHAHIFFQLVTAENKNTPVLELVNKAYSGFWGFATATNILSTEQFTKLVSSGEIQSLFKEKAVTEVVENVSCIEKRENTLFDNENLQVRHAHAEEYPKIQEKPNYSFPEKPQKPANPNGKTVMQLWNPDYQFMVIKNSTNDDSILINGLNGHIETNTWGKIIGSYSNYNINTNRYYYSKKYVVKDAYEPIWMLITFRETEEAQLRKRIKPITDAQTLDEIFESTDEPEILVHCLDNNKYYVINILYENKRFTRDFFNSLELDITTGEIIEGTRNGFCNSRRSIQIWKRIR